MSDAAPADVARLVEVERGDVGVLVDIERQHGDIGDHRAQDWSLRVTLVFRREEADWRLLHRHADALVHPITFEHVAELARGAWGPGPPSTAEASGPVASAPRASPAT